jgi:Gas vesicle synthesis protein GvpL/GvpF
MTVLLYAVTETNAGGGVDVRGLDDRPLRTIRDDGLIALVSDVETDPVPTEPNLWAYENVVERLMTNATVLPARFGATVRQDDEIKRMLASRHDEFVHTLGMVRGAVEIAIRAPTSTEQVTPKQTGTEYMLARLGERQHARQLAAEIDAAVGDLARARTCRPHSLNTLAYLVDHDQLEEFLRRLDELNDPEITWTGPWPPYSFTTPAGEAT